MVEQATGIPAVSANGTLRLHLGDLLSIVTGRLLAPDGMDGLYTAIEYLVGDEVVTHQLPRVCDEVTPHLLQQHPFLRDIQVPTFDGLKGQVVTWLARQCAQYGTWFDVSPVPAEVHKQVNPVTELASMMQQRREGSSS